MLLQVHDALVFEVREELAEEYTERILSVMQDIEAVIPEAEQRERINTLIFEELVKGRLESATREYFQGVVAELAGVGCDGVVMGCTEIPLILRPEDVEAPLLDSTRLLAQAALEEALGGA